MLDGYTETHHIIPLCVGGSNTAENLVVLTAAEHYIAHQLLVKLYPGHRGISWAAIAMSSNSARHQRSKNKLYAWLRKRHSQNVREAMLGNTYAKGRSLSNEHLAILRQPKTDEHKRRIGLGNLGKTKGRPRGPQSEDHKRKKGEARARAWQRLREAKGELSSSGTITTMHS